MTTYLAPLSTTSLEEDDEAFVISLTPLKSILCSVRFCSTKKSLLQPKVSMGYISRCAPKQNKKECIPKECITEELKRASFKRNKQKEGHFW